MKIFITGGTGFIGSYLINALHLLKHEVIVLKRENSKPRIQLNKELTKQSIIAKFTYYSIIAGLMILLFIAAT